jgi:hypothetical protein
VTHEAVHLAVPAHSAKFWLTVQSLCRETEKAKQWLCRHQAQLQIDLKEILKTAPERASNNSMQRTALRAAADAERSTASTTQSSPRSLPAIRSGSPCARV